MHKIRTWLILFFSITTSLLYGQRPILKGSVKSAGTGKPLFGAIVVDETNNGTATDSAGNFLLTLSRGKHTISFKCIGYLERQENMDFPDADGVSAVTIVLSEEAKELNTVVVSASKFEQRIQDVTVSMEVIKPSLVENRNTTTMDEVLEQVPGVNIIDGQANIRGGAGWSEGAGSRVMVLVDDLPELTADASDAKWEFLPVENLSQIEVIKGASSALYGSSAIDGVINIRTAYPGDTPLTKVNIYSGFYDTPVPADLKWWGNSPPFTSGASFMHSQKAGNFDIVLGANYYNNDGYQQGTPVNHIRFNGNFRYRFKKIEGLSAGINFNHMESGGNSFFIWANDTTGALQPKGGLNPDSTTISTYTTYRTTIDPFITYVDNHGNSFKLRTRYLNTINDNNTDQSSTGKLYYIEGQYQKHFSDQLTVTAGAVRSFSTVTAQLYGDHKSNNLAFFAQADAKWKRFTFSIGGRIEHYDLDSTSEKFTPVIRTGINYHLAKETYLRASYGQGYRFPSIAEKFISTEVGGLAIYPNPSLQSETGFSSEIGIMQGVKIGKWLGYVDLAGFLTQYHNMIEFSFAQWGPPTPPYYGLGFSSTNTGDTRIKGLDFSLSGSGEIASGLKATILAGWTHMDPRQITYDSAYIAKLGVTNYMGSDSSNFLKYRYSDLIKADVELTYKRFSFGISMRYYSFMKNIDKIFVSALGEQLVPGLAEYRNAHKTGDAIFDTHLAYQLTKAVKASFVVKNLLDREYMTRPADIQAPRSFTLQLSAAF